MSHHSSGSSDHDAQAHAEPFRVPRFQTSAELRAYFERTRAGFLEQQGDLAAQEAFLASYLARQQPSEPNPMMQPAPFMQPGPFQPFRFPGYSPYQPMFGPYGYPGQVPFVPITPPDGSVVDVPLFTNPGGFYSPSLGAQAFAEAPTMVGGPAFAAAAPSAAPPIHPSSEAVKMAVALLKSEIAPLTTTMAITYLVNTVASLEVDLIGSADDQMLPERARLLAAQQLQVVYQKKAASMAAAIASVPEAPAAPAFVPPVAPLAKPSVQAVLAKLSSKNGTLQVPLLVAQKQKAQLFDPDDQAGSYRRGLKEFYELCFNVISDPNDRAVAKDLLFAQWHLQGWKESARRQCNELLLWCQDQELNLTWESYVAQVNGYVLTPNYHAKVGKLLLEARYDPKSSLSLQAQSEDWFSLQADRHKLATSEDARNRLASPLELREYAEFLGMDGGGAGKWAYHHLLDRHMLAAPLPASPSAAADRNIAQALVNTITVRSFEIAAIFQDTVRKYSLIGTLEAERQAARQAGGSDSKPDTKKGGARAPVAAAATVAPTPTAPIVPAGTDNQGSSKSEKKPEFMGPCSHCGMAKGKFADGHHYPSGCFNKNAQGKILSDAERQAFRDAHLASKGSAAKKPGTQHWRYSHPAAPELREQLDPSRRIDTQLGSSAPTMVPGVLNFRQSDPVKTIKVVHPRLEESKEEFDKIRQQQESAKILAKKAALDNRL